MFSNEQVESAMRTVHAVMPPTPQYAWQLLRERLGFTTWVKHENHTPAGAFKVRGGLTYFETLRRVVLPAAAPGMLTGLILAMARAAGEVAPLMIVGMVKLAPTLPIDGHFPFVHFERKFMHLGFHIYDVGFQSPNVDATKPLVFATALLLILVVTAMNLVAISIRNRLRRKYAGSAV